MYRLLLSIFLLCTSITTLASNANSATDNGTHETIIRTVSFPSLDKLDVTADLYYIGDDHPLIILCHQARFSRGEYIESAKKFNELGYNCMAIDQRSGNEINNVINKTAYLAEKKGLKQDYLSAEQDIIAAINYASSINLDDIILLGSSYSASLVLKIASVNKKVRAVMSFSPGEYFGAQLNLQTSIQSLDVPCFITSSRKEFSSIKVLTSKLNTSKITLFLPNEEGKHGSKALWSSYKHNEEYWCAIKKFLKEL